MTVLGVVNIQDIKAVKPENPIRYYLLHKYFKASILNDGADGTDSTDSTDGIFLVLLL